MATATPILLTHYDNLSRERFNLKPMTTEDKLLRVIMFELLLVIVVMAVVVYLLRHVVVIATTCFSLHYLCLILKRFYMRAPIVALWRILKISH